MNQNAQLLLQRLFSQRRNEILDWATDWVIEQSQDLGGRRPREETLGLVERTLVAYEGLFLRGDWGPADRMIEFVTSLRASSEFRVSTPLKGFLSISKSVLHFVDRSQEDPGAVLDLMNALSDFYCTCAFRIADTHTAKLNHTVLERRRELETVLGAREQELQEKLATIESQRETLASLSSPVINIWDGILMMPLVGEITSDRASEAKRKLLDAIVEREARMVVLDITGLTVADSHCGAVLLRMIQAARLLGAEGLLVGMSGDVARTFLSLEIDLTQTRTFATLQEGLGYCLRRSGIALRSARSTRRVAPAASPGA